MTAEQVMKHLLEAGVDPDDPSTFIRHFRGPWGDEGFTPARTEEGEEKWVWREGPFSVEVTHHAPKDDWRAVRGAANYEVYAFIDVSQDPEDRRQNAYARKETTTEEKALAYAIRFKNEIMNSMAARLSKLGFTGWRNHWHRAPISVSLKKNFANIRLAMDYVPNEQVIPILTKLKKVTDRLA